LVLFYNFSYALRRLELDSSLHISRMECNICTIHNHLAIFDFQFLIEKIFVGLIYSINCKIQIFSAVFFNFCDYWLNMHRFWMVFRCCKSYFIKFFYFIRLLQASFEQPSKLEWYFFRKYCYMDRYMLSFIIGWYDYYFELGTNITNIKYYIGKCRNSKCTRVLLICIMVTMGTLLFKCCNDGSSKSGCDSNRDIKC